MISSAEREAVEKIITQLQPIQIPSDKCQFLAPDGTELVIAGISQATFFGGDRSGAVAILVPAGMIRTPCKLNYPLSVAGLVLLRREDESERVRTQRMTGYLAPKMVVEGLIVESEVSDTKIVAKLGCKSSYPVIITGGVAD